MNFSVILSLQETIETISIVVTTLLGVGLLIFGVFKI